VEEVIEFLRAKGFRNVREVEVMPENVRFGLPPEIVEAIGSAPAPAAAGQISRASAE
jgi:4-hydroxy-3-methylbut-2-enyl diphosphate reductase